MQKIIPHLWFDSEAEEAVAFYTSLFPGSGTGPVTRYGKEGFDIHRQPEGKVMTIDFNLGGYQLIALNAGPLFKLTPAISFFVVCETARELETLWQRLSDKGAVLMALDKYDWSEQYGWVQDRYGLSWQVSLGRLEDAGQKITPCFTYVSEQGAAEQAIKQYTAAFSNSEIISMVHYGPGANQPEGAVIHARFKLNGEMFIAMDSSPRHAPFTFNEALSLLVVCDSQAEVDHFWNRLGEGGEPGPCGWVKDRFGVSWQVSPAVLHKMLLDPDADKVARVTRAFMKMKKLDIAELEKAYKA